MSNAPMPTREELLDASLPQIASVIDTDWNNVFYAARPYLDAMYCINAVEDNYGQDSGESILVYFLSNAASWRGPVARMVKAELKRRIAHAR